ncbi:unnamed protein product, partial [Pylaiella littoralis]
MLVFYASEKTAASAIESEAVVLDDQENGSPVAKKPKRAGDNGKANNKASADADAGANTANADVEANGPSSSSGKGAPQQQQQQVV